MTVTDDRRIAEAATAGKWRQGVTDGRTVWAGDGCTLGWVPVGRHVADAAHIARFTPSRVLRYVVLAEAAKQLEWMWSRPLSVAITSPLSVIVNFRAALAALDAPDDKEARGE